jgi:hypothetical protein
MSESMERSRQATSGWRRISGAAISALFAFILARLTLRKRPALPTSTAVARLANHMADHEDDALDSHIRLRLPVTMASAPPEFTEKVLLRVASTPLLPQQVIPATRAKRSAWRSMRIVVPIFSVALTLMLLTGIVLTMVSPSLAVAILDAFMSAAIAALAFGRTLAQLIGRASATPWMIPAAMGGLLGFLLLSWVRFTRQFGRDPQEA